MHSVDTHGGVAIARCRRVLREEMSQFDLRSFMFTSLARILPAYSANRVRCLLLRLAGWDIGPRCTVPAVPRLIGARPGAGRLRIGESVTFGAGVLLDCAGPITIGDRSGVGHGVQLVTGHHVLGPSRQRLGALAPRPVTIGSGAWLAAGAVVLPGVTVGEGAVIAAGAVVTSDVEPNALYAGIPARKVRDLP